MLTSLLCEVRIWPVVWRRRLAYWLVGEKDNLAFLAMLGLPILAVTGIIYFAYVDGTRIQPARIQAVQREATRARRRASDLQCLAENIYFEDRKSTRLNSSHITISYAVFCLKKKKKQRDHT